jgi:2-aminoethylphosphonate-pyruvate transaminase
VYPSDPMPSPACYSHLVLGTIRQALILAAGQGRPVAESGTANCLTKVGGSPLLLRTLRVLGGAGIRRVAITLGFDAQRVRKDVEAMKRAENDLPELVFFDNPAWERPNGLSVLAARNFVTERTLLVMSDQIAAPHLVREMAQQPCEGELTVLAVDPDLSRVFDFDDATKVKLWDHKSRDKRVSTIGKNLADHDAVSTGLFVMSPTLLACLDDLAKKKEPSLTEGVAEAARRGLVVAHDVAGAIWQDVDSAEMRLHAEWLLRVYGDDLLHPGALSTTRSTGADTLALIESLLAEKNLPRYTLFNPGPVVTSAGVKAALVHYDVCHRDEDYSGVVRRLQQKLRPVFGASQEHEMLLLTGSGTAAMEMAVASVVPEGKKILTVANGAFGERLGEIARLHRLPHVSLSCPWGTLPDPAALEAMLIADPEIAVVAMIHHETSIGVVNPVGAVGRICRARSVTLVVDAVSSLGAEDLDVVRDNIDVCLSSANKCLHSVSGVSFICVAPEVWPRIADVPPRVYYLDLKRYRRYLTEVAQTPFTPAVSSFFALEKALDELFEQGGVQGRRETYRRRNLLIRRVLTDLGFQSFTNTGRESHTIFTARVPAFLKIDDLYARMKDRGFIIYRCKGELGAHHIQIANMGELPDATIDAFLGAMAEEVGLARAAAPAKDRERLRSL